MSYQEEPLSKSIEVAITGDNPVYWIMIVGAIVFGFFLNSAFNKLSEDNKIDGLKLLGVFMILIQIYIPVSQYLDPEYQFTFQHNLPFHFCSVNFWLMAFNCFFRSRRLFYLTAYLGIVGGFHSFVSPLLTGGYSAIQVSHYIIVHSTLVSLPLVMIKHFKMEFMKFDWVKAYFFDVVISTFMIGINDVLNHFVYNPDTDMYFANYMYVTRSPEVDNPFLSDLAWPYYMLPLHVLLIVHMLVINWAYKWGRGEKLQKWTHAFH